LNTVLLQPKEGGGARKLEVTILLLLHDELKRFTGRFAQCLDLRDNSEVGRVRNGK
jgi:hypothetical protein